VLTFGLDIGSTTSKCVLLRDGAEIAAHALVAAGIGTSGAQEAVEKALESVKGEEIAAIAVTGYGRESWKETDYRVSELTCHAMAAHLFFPQARTLIDIGGQDTKYINVKNGRPVDFLMNDKCAAGTGKFIEVMANRLGLTIEELFELAEIGKPISISSLCTVFAESEVINYMGEGRSREDLAAGVIDSVALKVATLVQRKELQDTIIITGGFSNNEFFASLLGKKLGKKALAMPDGRYAGAYGAALLARERSNKA